MSEPELPEPHMPNRDDNPNELPAWEQALLDHRLGQLRSIAIAKAHQPGPWRFGPISEEGPYTLQAECALCGALLTIHLNAHDDGFGTSGRYNTATRFSCPQRHTIPPHPPPRAGEMTADEFLGLLRIPVGESFPSEQALLDHMRALPGFTIVGSPGATNPWHPGLYWVQLRREADAARGMLGFRPDATGGYRFEMADGDIDPAKLVGLLGVESFPSEQALLEHLRTLPGFTLVGSPGPYWLYWVDLRREADGALGRVFLEPDARGGYRYYGQAALRNPRYK